MMFHKSESSGLDIAIIGMAGRFPGAPDVDAFWKNVQDGIESIHQYTDQELRDLGVSEELINDPDYVKAGIPFEGKDLFDTEFFGYTPRDAARIDPQQRVFLESAWHAIEHAGYAAQFQKDRIGVYAGAGTSYYLLRHLMPSQPVDQGAGITELLGLMSGNSADSLATRVAYKLGLRGPAVTVQTACSTSLTSVHMACQALLGNECDMALAGGVSLNLLQKGGYRYQQGAILSPDGHCRAFDAKAGGTLVGSGVALVVLKRLEDALRDGDTIHAIIKGSAANNDGADKAGYTAPSISGQTAVIRAALAMADVSADSIGLIEAHGTGTTLGDPIEIAALTEAFRHDTNRHGYCAIGSVKTNVGHLDAAAGVTGLIKAALSVRDGVLPASLNFESPNPKIDFENSPFKVNTETRPWPPDAWPRRAGVSSFGIGGTNVHVVLEEPPSSEVIRNQRPQNPLHERADPDQKARLLMLSAQNEAALADIARELAAWLDRHPSVSLPDVSRTLRVGRGAFRHRLGIVANTVSEAVKALRTLAPDGSTAAKALEAPSVAFLFPGQGAQHPGMARALYEQDDAFRETVDRCCTLLKPELGLDLRTLLVADGDQGDLTARLAQTAITQPALFVIEYAMAQWWIGQGIRPDAMIGHSVGEYAAACVSGVFSLEDALRLMAARGRLLQATNAGAMLAVSEAESALKQVMPAGCDLAAVNAPDLCVLAGTVEAIEQAEQQLSSQGVGVRRLMVSHAFHSVLVEPMLARFEAFLNQVRLSPPGIPFISNLSGRWITADEACSPAYWCQHVRGTVRFENGLKTLMEKQTRMLLEVGPGETLATLARRHPAVGQRQVLSSQCHPQRVAQNAVQPLRCLAQMWSRGVDVSNAPLLQEPGARRIPLPGYPFQRQSYWIDAVEDAATPSGMQEPDRRGNGQIASSPSGWLHHPVWQRALPLTVPRDAVAVSGPIVVFGEDDVLTQVLVEQTTSLTREVIRVMPGTGFERVATNTYRVMSGDRQEMKKLWQAMETDHGRPAHVVHLWCLDSPGRGRESMPLDRGFHTLLALVQAIDDLQSAGEASPLSITIVANGIEDVTGLEPLCPEKATLQGIRLVVPQEYPHVRCALIDVINPDTADDALRLSQQVLAEIQNGLPDSIVAWRGAHRWLKSYQPLPTRQPVSSAFRQKGVYLITGGFGGIGLVVARHLAETYQARLILIGRSPIDEGRQAEIRMLEAMGAEVLGLQADVGMEGELSGAFFTAHQHFGKLHGVIHAAGVPGGGVISRRTHDAVAEVLKPKIDGALLLLEAAKPYRADFILMCSSLTAVLGGIGQLDYCAANCVVDAFANLAARKQDGLVVSVNWDAWRGTGMAKAQSLQDGVGIRAVHVEELLESILTRGLSQVLVSTLSMDEQQWRLNDLQLAEELLPEVEVKNRRGPRPSLSSVHAEPEGELEKGLAELWAELLGIDGIGIDGNLFELGGDSLLAIQLLARVKSQYRVELQPAAFLKAPTIRLLAGQVEARLIEEIEAEAP